jgi:predicted secreted Zn-dependent protease
MVKLLKLINFATYRNIWRKKKKHDGKSATIAHAAPRVIASHLAPPPLLRSALPPLATQAQVYIQLSGVSNI